MHRILLFILAIVLPYLVAADDAVNACHEHRYVFDIGSGSTKSGGFLVDTCEKKVINILPKYNILMGYGACLNDPQNKSIISEVCLEKGIAVLKGIQDSYAINCKTHVCTGVATAWARNALNKEAVLERIRDEGIDLEIISQEKEGELAFKAASLFFADEVSQNDIFVWDIGGGSFQFSYLIDDQLHVYHGKYGMHNFDDHIRTKFNIKKDYADKSQVKRIIDSTIQEMQELFREDETLSEIRDRNDMKIVGMGALLGVGLKSQLMLGTHLEKRRVYEAILRFSGRNAKNIHKIFPKLSPEVAKPMQMSLILIYAIMEALNLDVLEVEEISIAQYVAIHGR